MSRRYLYWRHGLLPDSDLGNDLIFSPFRHFALLTYAEMHEMQEAHVWSVLVVTSANANFAGYSK